MTTAAVFGSLLASNCARFWRDRARRAVRSDFRYGSFPASLGDSAERGRIFRSKNRVEYRPNFHYHIAHRAWSRRRGVMPGEKYKTPLRNSQSAERIRAPFHRARHAAKIAHHEPLWPVVAVRRCATRRRAGHFMRLKVRRRSRAKTRLFATARREAPNFGRRCYRMGPGHVAARLIMENASWQSPEP